MRRFSLLATAGLLGIAVLLGWVSARPSMSASSAARLVSATSYFDSTIVLARNARPVGARGDMLAISLGYLERERTGITDPFKLADLALHDPRIDTATASRVAWALLGRLRRGDAYAIDPSVLEGSGPWSSDGHGAVGSAHITLIERAIGTAPDPRSGELAVRLAYMLESGKGRIAPNAASIATDVAALVRDRALAVADLRDLLADATERREDALDLLVARRETRSLRVEQPSLAPLSSLQRTYAMREAVVLARAIDTLDRVAASHASPASAPVLGARFAARLADIGRAQPPVAPVMVTLRGVRGSALHATNDEVLAAEHARLGAEIDATRRTTELALLWSAVALRPFAQAAPWFVGDAGPDASDLGREFGLLNVKFARSVPAEWRPYYLREFAGALRDMQDVFPAFSVAGLGVSFGTTDLPDSALAMHDPRTRTLVLNVNASSGTLAHELAHDLDWQTSRRLFAAAGGYSTDRAMREQRGALAASIRGLAAAKSLRPGPNGTTVVSSDRPAELFARGADWFTASSLALRGRMNGFLSAVQDASLPGYAAGAPTAVGFAGTNALIATVDQMTFVPDSVLGAFESVWSDAARLDPAVLVRHVLATSPGRQGFGPRGALIPPTLASVTVPVCTAGDSDEDQARRELIAASIEARAYGLALRRARYRWRGPGAPRADWVNGLLGVPPFSASQADAVVASLANGIAAELRASAANQGMIPMAPAGFESAAGGCAAIGR